MRLKPVKFIGHKIGPFEHIELNWDKNSHYTLIVAENGMGKTTLVAAMAACLSVDNDKMFPPQRFERFARDKETYIYFEVNVDGEIGWSLRWMSQADQPQISHSEGIRLPGLTTKENFVSVWEADYPGAYSVNWSTAATKVWRTAQEVSILAAAYGVGRDLEKPRIQEQRDLEGNPLNDILNPFAPIPSNEIFQWIATQHINHALALAENKPDEAQAYLAAIQRVERLLNEGLEYPISFQVKRNPFRLEVKQNGTILSVDQLSDGARSFLSWPLDYLMRASRVNWANPTDSAIAPGLILVDEIDAHLHPEWQRRVMPMVSQLLPETHIIATTHSPFVLGSVDEAQVFQIYEDEAGRLSVKSSFDELYGYPADLVLERAFVPSLYTPEVQHKLQRLSDLASKVAGGDISASERKEHDQLLQELAEVNPWLSSLLALSQSKEPSAS